VEARLPVSLKQVSALRAYNWPPPRADMIGYQNEDLQTIAERLIEGVPVIAIHYLISGKTNGVPEAIWCLRQLKNYNRVGWFAWSGGAFPQIKHGGLVRVTSYAYDWLYEAMTPDERKDIEAYLVMCGRDFFQLNLIGPGMLMHHLRHNNHGNNAFCSGLAATLVTRDVNPDADRWLRAYLNTYLWNLTHAFGPGGQDLENDLGGYWTIALDAVVQSAVMIRNTLNIDFLTHPHLRPAHRFWIAHLAPCKPVAYHGGSERRETAYDKSFEGYAWVQNAPACTVHPAHVSNTMLLLAGLNRDGEGLDLWMKAMGADKTGPLNPAVLKMSHTGYLGSILALNWFPPDLTPTPVEGPLYFFSERLALWRSGLRSGADSMLTFSGGQMNFIERGEQLGTGVGLVWHNPHFHYACAQNTLWTEGVDLQPGYRLAASWDGRWVKYFSATGAFSNTRYYVQPEQLHAHRHFETLQRDMLWAGGRFGVILDRVAHAEPRSHAFTWNALNTDRNAELEFGANRATLRRRKVALDLHFAEPARLSFFARPTHLMPVWNFSWSEHGLAFDAREGEGLTSVESVVEIPVESFAGVKIIRNMQRLSLDAPTEPSDVAIEKGTQKLGDFDLEAQPPPPVAAMVTVGASGAKDSGPKTYRHRTRYPIVGGRYYTLELVYSKFHLRQYHNPAWQEVATFYDETGKPLNKAGWENLASACLTKADGEVPLLNRAIARQQVAVPADAVTVGFEIETWDIFEASGQRNAPTTTSDLYVHSLRMLQHPSPERTQRIRFLTVLQSRDVSEPVLPAETHRFPSGSVTRLRHPDGSQDIVVSAEEPVEDPTGLFRFQGRLGVLRVSAAARLEQAFFERTVSFESGPLALSLTADQPVTLELTPEGVTLKCTVPSTFALQKGSAKASASLAKGFHRLDGTTFQPLAELVDRALETPTGDLTAYQRGVGRHFAAMDATVSAPALGDNKLRRAAFRASSVLQERFAADRVNDGRVAKAYGDGALYYGEAEIPSAPLGGYGGDGHTAEYPWPYRVQPTYWLAANEEKDAWIEAELPRVELLTRARLFNTCNAGFNDRAMIDFRIDLFDEDGRLVKSVTDHFGTPVPESVSYPGQTYGGGVALLVQAGDARAAWRRLEDGGLRRSCCRQANSGHLSSVLGLRGRAERISGLLTAEGEWT